MEQNLKKILRALSLELRHILEGAYDDQRHPTPGDLDRRLNQLGVWRDRPAKSVEELPQLSAEDRAARAVVDGYLQLRAEAGVSLSDAVGEFVRESAYTWANRLLTLRCMEARGIIDDVILQKDAYAGRSLVHHRFASKNPGAVRGEDDGLFAILFDQFAERSRELPELFDPASPAVALRPSPAALKRCIVLLSGKEALRGQDPATDEVFAAPDALGWTYQYYQTEEKDRVDARLKNEKGFKCEGADIVPKTSLYTESYIVKFLVQNSLGAIWMGMHPESPLAERWEYFVRDADRVAAKPKPVSQITFLDPACGSGHFLLEAFDLFYAMCEAEGHLTTPREIAASILNENLFGIDIDGCAVQIAHAALWMKAREKAPDLAPGDLTTFHHHLVATNIRLPKGADHIEAFLEKHPEDQPFRPALEVIFASLGNAPELGSLLKLEEPLDRRMRELKADYDRKQASGGIGPQLGLYGKATVQHRLPVGTESYEAWRDRVLAALIEHFAAESRAADPAQGFFGESAGKGLILADLLRRRYDVVAANPPYMGSGSMGPTLKTYVQSHYREGKRDLYAAFILRCRELAGPVGRVAMVTQHSWMFLRSFADLRATQEPDILPQDDEPGHWKRKTAKDSPPAFAGLLREATIETMAHLGPHAFSEISGEVVNVTLFVFSCRRPADDHRLTAFRLIGPKSPEEKDDLLRTSIAGRAHGVVSSSQQRRFAALPQSPLCYWLRESLLDCVASAPTKLRRDRELFISEGIGTRAESRFLRYDWEVPCTEPSRWLPYSKGGGYAKWHGFGRYRVDWGDSGGRPKSYIRDTYPPDKFTLLIRHERFYGSKNLTFSSVASGSLGVRFNGAGLFSDAGPGVFWVPNDEHLALVAIILNCRLMSYLARALSSGGLTLNRTYVEALPVTQSHMHMAHPMNCHIDHIVNLKCRLIAQEPTERTFEHLVLVGASICDAFRHYYSRLEAIASILHALEGLAEREVFKIYGIDGEDLDAVLNETGIPVGWLPLITGYDTIPLLHESVPFSSQLAKQIVQSSPRSLSSQEFTELKRGLRVQYMAGSGTQPETAAEDAGGEADATKSEDGDGEAAVGAHIPIPTETFLEELSQKLQVHPISVYWLLEELRAEGIVCVPERKRFTEDRFSVIVLRLLGHRWPKQVEANEPVPDWADWDGVIPITEAAGEQTLVQRMRQRISEEFPDGNVQAIEREFEEFVGTPLEPWLGADLFKRHVSQFKKRPIAWQLSSTPPSGGRRKGSAPEPVFSCLIYYHKLDGDLLPKIRSHYVGTLRGGFQTELTTLERLADPTDERKPRKVQLTNWIDELKSLDEALIGVIAEGFGTNDSKVALRQYAIDDAMLCLKQRWLRRLVGVIEAGPLGVWRADADGTGLHHDLGAWVAESMSHLHRHCGTVGPTAPESPPTDPDAGTLAAIIGPEREDMVSDVLDRAKVEWRAKLDEAIVKPLKAKLKALNEEDWQAAGLWDSHGASTAANPGAPGLPGLPGSGGGKGPDDDVDSRPEPSSAEISLHRKALQAEIKRIEEVAGGLAARIRRWTCPEAAGWEHWLASQPMYDEISSVDGLRAPARTVAEFVAQEIAYVPDINDGVRVNIAPLQRAGLLAADVLATKDLEKAIADRADWRADERRWCREGKLPQPGWWADKQKPWEATA